MKNEQYKKEKEHSTDFISRYDLIYKVPSRCWQDGLTIGNGDLAAIAWENGSSQLEYQVNHSGLWDERSAPGWGTD